MKLTGEQTINRKDFDGKPAYSIPVSKKKEDGTWINVYIPVSFRKGVSVGNKTKIDIKDAWLNCYEGKNGAVLTIFVNDFDTLAPGEKYPQGFEYATVSEEDCPF
jgi:hypothetical protein